MDILVLVSGSTAGRIPSPILLRYTLLIDLSEAKMKRFYRHTS